MNHSSRVPLKAVAYLRVSTDDQTVENQRIVLTNWANANNYEIIQFFEDPAVSGSVPAAERAGFGRLISFVKNNYINAVLVYELSRVGRTFYDTLDAIKFVERYAPLISCSPKELFLQTTEPSVRKLLIGILTWVAEREREVLITRIKAGLDRARAEGKKLGPKYKQIDFEELKILLDSPLSMQEVADRLGISKPTLYSKIRMMT